MDLVFLLPTIFIASIFCFVIFRHKINHGRLGVRVPEAGGSWPIIGHLHLLSGSQLTHRLLGSMADKFGPIFTIKAGAHPILVVNSSETAKECLTTNGRAFASRPVTMALEVMGYNNATITLAPYGPYWRHIRKLTVLELTSQRFLQMLNEIRITEVKSFIEDIYRTWERNKGSSETVLVDMKKLLGNLNLTILLRMMFGDQFSSGDEKGQRFRDAVSLFVDLFGVFAPSELIPGLRWLDLGGHEKKMKETAKELDVLLNGWLEDSKRMMNSTSTKKVDESGDQMTFMAALLSRVKEEMREGVYGFSTDEIVKATCLDIFSASYDSTALTVTWALALLINNPLVLEKAQQELDTHVGRDRKVEMSDMNKLVYVHAIIQETMRLYPAGPLGLPRESIENCIVGGYTVPKGTHLLVNIWKIHHDPKIWTDPLVFQPERFLTTKKETDVMGQNFEYIPFGSGRRVCMGISFTMEATKFILASIIHNFDFQNPSNEQIDMTERPGVILNKAYSLELLVAPRLLPHLYGVLG